jgi:hypothetical protein
MLGSDAGSVSSTPAAVISTAAQRTGNRPNRSASRPAAAELYVPAR